MQHGWITLRWIFVWQGQTQWDRNDLFVGSYARILGSWAGWHRSGVAIVRSVVASKINIGVCQLLWNKPKLISRVLLNPYLLVCLWRQCSGHYRVYSGYGNVDNLATVLVPCKYITNELLPSRGEWCPERCVIPLDSDALCYGSIIVRLICTYLERAEHVAELLYTHVYVQCTLTPRMGHTRHKKERKTNKYR